MIVYRVCHRNYANDLSGEGARIHGGRWNHKGIPCIYTSGSRALAVLEYSANVNIDFIPRALCIAVVEIPDKHILMPEQRVLPGDWYRLPAPASAKDFGSSLLKKAEHLVLRLPSVVVPEEFNYVVNPLHPEIAAVKCLDVNDLVYDLRIKQ